ncbi:hypothetical protein X975_14004, partial [Stegodyphus mimosarum]
MAANLRLFINRGWNFKFPLLSNFSNTFHLRTTTIKRFESTVQNIPKLEEFDRPQ